jgi:hypothetical protein
MDKLLKTLIVALLFNSYNFIVIIMSVNKFFKSSAFTVCQSVTAMHRVSKSGHLFSILSIIFSLKFTIIQQIVVTFTRFVTSHGISFFVLRTSVRLHRPLFHSSSQLYVTIHCHKGRTVTAVKRNTVTCAPPDGDKQTGWFYILVHDVWEAK